jgi:dTDP-4-dehydrorhamnose 3,5-epimerase
MKFIKSGFPDIFLIEPDVYKDDRGFFMETYHQSKYTEAGISKFFVQDNYSHSKYGVLRGLHYQLKYPQGKLVSVIKGEIFDVVVDIRWDSPKFGQWFGVRLSEKNKRQIYVPEGFAHGFVVLSENADVIYKCTNLYVPGDDYGIFWADPTINIDWPVKTPILSPKDSKNSKLGSIPRRFLPTLHLINESPLS